MRAIKFYCQEILKGMCIARTQTTGHCRLNQDDLYVTCSKGSKHVQICFKNMGSLWGDRVTVHYHERNGKLSNMYVKIRENEDGLPSDVIFCPTFAQQTATTAQQYLSEILLGMYLAA